MAILIHKRRWTFKPPVGAQLDRGHPLSIGLVGCWLFNEAGGGQVRNLVDTVVSSADSAQTWNTGRMGSALNFSGSSPQHIDAGLVPAFQNWSAFTLETWSKRSGGTDQYLVAKGSDSIGMGQFTGGNAVGWIFIKIGAAFPSVTGAISIPTGEWHHQVGVWTGEVLRLYVDGVQDGSDVSASGSLNSQDSFNLGIGYAPVAPTASHYQGDIGLVRVWSRALSKREIQDLYVSPYANIAPAPSRLWLGPSAAATSLPPMPARMPQAILAR